jgi:hypothetical protein
MLGKQRDMRCSMMNIISLVAETTHMRVSHFAKTARDVNGSNEIKVISHTVPIFQDGVQRASQAVRL